MDRRSALITMGLSPLSVSLLAGCGQEGDREDTDADAETTPDDGLVDLLFVQEAESVRFEGDEMTLVNVSPKTLFFSDRPDEVAGYLSYAEFVSLVSEGPDSFEDDPPNATLVVLGGSEFSNVVVKLAQKPRLEGTHLRFPTVEIIDGDPPAHGNAVALFIDTIGRPMSPGSVAGVHRRHRRRRRRATHR